MGGPPPLASGPILLDYNLGMRKPSLSNQFLAQQNDFWAQNDLYEMGFLRLHHGYRNTHTFY